MYHRPVWIKRAFLTRRRRSSLDFIVSSSLSNGFLFWGEDRRRSSFNSREKERESDCSFQLFSTYLFQVENYSDVLVAIPPGQGGALPPLSRARVEYVGDVVPLAGIRAPRVAHPAPRRLGRFAEGFRPFLAAGRVHENIRLRGHVERRREYPPTFQTSVHPVYRGVACKLGINQIKACVKIW